MPGAMPGTTWRHPWTTWRHRPRCDSSKKSDIKFRIYAKFCTRRVKNGRIAHNFTTMSWLAPQLVPPGATDSAVILIQNLSLDSESTNNFTLDGSLGGRKRTILEPCHAWRHAWYYHAAGRCVEIENKRYRCIPRPIYPQTPQYPTLWIDEVKLKILFSK